MICPNCQSSDVVRSGPKEYLCNDCSRTFPGEKMVDDRPKLDSQQRKLYYFIRNNLIMKAPTFEVMRRYMEFKSNQSVLDLLHQLQKMEYIDRKYLPKEAV